MACWGLGLDVLQFFRDQTTIRQWGFSQFRVRDHDGFARIEVGRDELDAALDPDFASAARERLSEIGFDHVTLDLHGYRTGSVSPEGKGNATPRAPPWSSTRRRVSPPTPFGRSY